jgi:hypothetical protein
VENEEVRIGKAGTLDSKKKGVEEGARAEGY